MKRVIISGGGTGGHIFPAIAIANALKAREKEIELLFIGAKGRMEMSKVPDAGYTIIGLTISGFQRRLTWKNLLFPFKLAASMLKARSVISKFRPDVVIGVGGYASGPTLRMATSLGIPALIQEQNSFPGVTNRLLGARVQKICVAYDGMSAYFPAKKILFTGNPIRQDLMKITGKREEAIRHFTLDAEKKTLLVIGGSLGAGTINQAMLRFVTEGAGNHSFQILWQTGKHYYEAIHRQFNELKPSNSILLPFIDRMDLAYAAADIIVSRAGAIAISELCVVGKPVILVPSPNVAEDHQTKNARALADKNAALLVTDSKAHKELGPAIESLFADRSMQEKLTQNIRKLGITDAADRIAEAAMELIQKDEVRRMKEVKA
jgi:UDP-N-acetylglucosamine--N-acetylmuramyl-(pentapeptide) pyrophosphoryl-undecaprenol N-acetylglucosamine transferase